VPQKTYPSASKFGASVVQGKVLGFAVSGTDNQSILTRTITPGAEGITGDAVGLEGSLARIRLAAGFGFCANLDL
jgi:hypothetical protein